MRVQFFVRITLIMQTIAREDKYTYTLQFLKKTFEFRFIIIGETESTDTLIYRLVY